MPFYLELINEQNVNSLEIAFQTDIDYLNLLLPFAQTVQQLNIKISQPKEDGKGKQ